MTEPLIFSLPSTYLVNILPSFHHMKNQWLGKKFKFNDRLVFHKTAERFGNISFPLPFAVTMCLCNIEVCKQDKKS